MNILQDVQKLAVKKKMPEIKAGLTVRVHQRISEGGKERIQIFEGLVIKVNSGFGADKSITVRKLVQGIGVEKVFPLHSTNIVKLEIKKKSKVRRAKLYYMRDRQGKSARLKEEFISSKELEESVEELAEIKAEEAEAEAPVETAEEGVQTEAEKQDEVKEEAPEEAKEEEPKEEEKKEE